MKVTLAIPNYNGLENLKTLIPRVAGLGFHEIIVMDDVSTDDSNSFLESFPSVTLIKGEINLGPAGNRNRVIGKATGDLIYFIDADMELIYDDTVSKLESLFLDTDKVIVGGLILAPHDEPMWWNYGYEMNFIRGIKASILHRLAFLFWENTSVLNVIRNLGKNITKNFEITFDKPNEIMVDWVSEAHFCIRRAVFEDVGGFDANFRYHADQDLCKRLRNRGYKIYYNNCVATKHMEIDTFGKTRKKKMLMSSLYFYKKHWGKS